VRLKRALGHDVLQPAASSTVLRRLAGPLADELAILGRPEGPWQDSSQQAEAAYRGLAEQLAAHQSSFSDLASETLFLSDIRRDLPRVLDARARVLAELGQSALAPLPSFIQQAPIDRDASLELAASIVIPRHRDTWSAGNVLAVTPCACDGCARSGARLVRLGDEVSLHTTNVYGAGRDAYEQAWDMFCVAERLLRQCGMGFGDVVRTWIHLRDIDRDYDALNMARREFFRQRSIELRPASTGVQGGPWPDAHGFSLSLRAVKSPLALDVTRMSTPTLNEAWSYGADFSRGLRLTEANKVTLYISGTASIDESGHTVHVGNFEAQANRMLDNIASLLAQQGASFENLVSGVTYLKNPSHAPALRSMYRRRGLNDMPLAVVQAPLCRQELLCETEAVALLPLAIAGA
jgi:enamine deaminase RidA (YjgF/YER057c/UK114 family)